ncbi:NAD(P)/FAD-dependent oxidoreductase [Lewinella cohaerens]|uniref:NAD(P)/FAD-dependent oxidoreductase n=1 Tax=Lewinella cohaerens TaxID=70995 RepID=UPI003CCB9542
MQPKKNHLTINHQPSTKKNLIIGHGIAGALFGYFLEQAGEECIYLDAPDQKAATQVAAGIINPITGRRFVKSWRIDDLVPFAQQLYRKLEQELDIQFYHERPLVRTLFNRGDENNWQARILEDAYQDYFHEPPRLGNIPTLTDPAFSYLEVTQTAQVTIGVLVDALKAKRKEEGRFYEEAFAPEQLVIRENDVQYGDLVADRVLFCEGWRARFNPWFGNLPYGGNKGEVLLIRLPNAQLEQMFKHRIFIVPFTDDLYWVGSTSENQFTSEDPTPEGKAYLQARLEEVLTTPYELVDHRAAIRPTVKDRRPFLGMHPQYPQLGIFNGLGTKGASLAPFWAKHFADYLAFNKELDFAVDIQRFK